MITVTFTQRLVTTRGLPRLIWLYPPGLFITDFPVVGWFAVVCVAVCFRCHARFTYAGYALLLQRILLRTTRVTRFTAPRRFGYGCLRCHTTLPVGSAYARRVVVCRTPLCDAGSITAVPAFLLRLRHRLPIPQYCYPTITTPLPVTVGP